MTSRALAAAGLAVFVLALAGCGSSYSNPAASTPVPTGGGGGVAADVTIGISGFSFTGNPGSVKAGQTVAWHNGDSVAHTATSDGGAFDTGAIAPGATSSPITMSAAGSFSYHCAIHPNMVGSVTVGQ
jgi:plastocyanin